MCDTVNPIAPTAPMRAAGAAAGTTGGWASTAGAATANRASSPSPATRLVERTGREGTVQPTRARSAYPQWKIQRVPGW